MHNFILFNIIIDRLVDWNVVLFRAVSFYWRRKTECLERTTATFKVGQLIILVSQDWSLTYSPNTHVQDSNSLTRSGHASDTVIQILRSRGFRVHSPSPPQYKYINTHDDYLLFESLRRVDGLSFDSLPRVCFPL